jgi:hypothetical protein
MRNAGVRSRISFACDRPEPGGRACEGTAMAWIRMPEPQQRGAQMPTGNEKGNEAVGDALDEALGGREGMGHRYADLDVSPTGEPQPAGIDYPATNPPERQGDIAPTRGDDQHQTWDDVVQPENHARQVDGPSTKSRGASTSGGAAEAGPDDLPLPEGK